GERPVTRARRRRRVVAPVLGLALLAAAWFGRPVYDDVFDFIRDNTTDPKPVRPTGVSASSELPGMSAGAAFDGAKNQPWSPDALDKSAELVAAFDQPVRLVNVIVTPGVSADQDQFLTYGRPQKLTLRFVTTDGQSSTQTLTLTDKAGAQTFKLGGKNDVHEVHIVIDSVYGPPDRPPAIAEVEFFRAG
ncbi:MAG: hypothetical protein HOV68_03630, partial [Streptomycetaceae bacterium]|nr:hypothetical protein [Streptomycetaceae bacterium]